MRLRHSTGLGVFCLLVGSRWLVAVVTPEGLPSLLGQSLGFAVAGAVAGIAISLRKHKAEESSLRLTQLIVAGLLLYIVPALLRQLGPSGGSGTRVALYALAPLCVVLGVTIVADEASRTLMMPSLAGLAGALLLLPWRLPVSAVEAGALALAFSGVLLTALGSVWTYVLIRGRSTLQSIVVIALSNAAVLCLCGVIHRERLAPATSGDCVAMLFDVAPIFLFVWLAGRIAPERLASRYFLVPLVTILEGAAMLRALPDVRMAIGCVLLLFGAGSLLFKKKEESVLLHLH